MKCIFRKAATTAAVLMVSLSSLLGQNGPPWVKTNLGFNYIMMAMDFPGNQNNIGYICGESLTYQGDGIVIKTTDGGNTWNSVWTGADMGVEGASFVDVSTGFIAGWPNASQNWSGFGKTTDGGATWTSLLVTSDVYYFTDVIFKDASNGIVMGMTQTSAGVWKTSNGGTTWTPCTGIAGVPNGGCYVSGNTYFIVDNAGHIQKSTNNGSTWTTVYTIPGLILTGIDFYDDNTGMASGDYGVIVKTYDGGVTWEMINIGTDIWRDFGWETPDHVFACGTPEIVAESWDGGATWVNGFPGSTYQAALYECVFTENGSGFICGSQGTLLKRAPACTAGFTASATQVCTGDAVNFTDQSYGSISTWNWTFEGGTPSTSLEPNPVVTYNTPGVFDVRLIVTNGSWTDTLLQQNYITASMAPATPVIQANGFTLTSNASTGNQWYLNGVALTGATGQTHEASQTGWYWDVVMLNGCSSDTSNNIYLVMTGADEQTSPSLSVSPVPCRGEFTLSLEGAVLPSADISIYSTSGICVYRENGANLTLPKTISLGSTPPGIYTLLVQDKDQVHTRKILVSR